MRLQLADTPVYINNPNINPVRIEVKQDPILYFKHARHSYLCVRCGAEKQTDGYDAKPVTLFTQYSFEGPPSSCEFCGTYIPGYRNTNYNSPYYPAANMIDILIAAGWYSNTYTPARKRTDLLENEARIWIQRRISPQWVAHAVKLFPKLPLTLMMGILDLGKLAVDISGLSPATKTWQIYLLANGLEVSERTRLNTMANQINSTEAAIRNCPEAANLLTDIALSTEMICRNVLGKRFHPSIEAPSMMFKYDWPEFKVLQEGTT
jgi:hypothetical protein